MTISVCMQTLKEEARRSHCRVKQWKLTEDQAWAFAEEIAWIAGKSPEAIVKGIKWGLTHAFDAPIRLVSKPIDPIDHEQSK